MTLKELSDYLLINTNQYYIGAENIEVTPEVLKGISKRALSVYSNAKPKRYRKYNFKITKEITNLFEIDNREIVNILQIYMSDPVFFEVTVPFNWEYDVRNHILFAQMQGDVVIDFLVKPNLDDISYDDMEFLNMVTGLYLMYIAEVRKGFKLDELPFSNDADELYSEGKELFENTRDQIQEETGGWYFAIKGLV